MSWIVVSLHDVAPRTIDSSRRWMNLLDRYALRASLLVVPGPWKGGPRLDNPRHRASIETVQWLRQRRALGDELVLHGWEHVEPQHPAAASTHRQLVGTLLARGCAEFWQLDGPQVRDRLHKGRSAMAIVGLSPAGFVAPGWLMSPATIGELQAEGFGHTSTHCQLIDLETGRRWNVPALSQRPGAASTGAAAKATVMIARRMIAARRPIRLAVHPNDLADSRCREAVLAIAAAAHRAGYESLTYGDVVGLQRHAEAQALAAAR